ncbi:MAG: YggS family pyridoxal phosphate-dependent enzyme [Microbacteriaceae bacterium]
MQAPANDQTTLAERLEASQSAVADAARLADRDPASITTVVVTKFHPAEVVRELATLGVRDFGENRHQDAAPKAAELADLNLRWHFVGQLQSKKARAALAYASVIHSVDRSSLVAAIAGSHVDVFIQLNLTDDPARGGVQPTELAALAEAVLEAPNLRLLGLMAVAPLGEQPRAAFARVREHSERLRTIAPDATFLSMGMSGDFRDAIHEGATHLRIGTAITGNRPAHG